MAGLGSETLFLPHFIYLALGFIIYHVLPLTGLLISQAIDRTVRKIEDQYAYVKQSSSQKSV